MNSVADKIFIVSEEIIPLQQFSSEIFDMKYFLKDKEENRVENCADETFRRIAVALASNEKRTNFWADKFEWAMQNGAIPAGRVMSNAGAEEYKPATSLINCTVSTTIQDSMHSILMANVDAGMTLKAGCGIGYNFSTLRPKGAYVSGAGASTSGPLSFMDIFDKTCFTVSSAGGRRGAQMATMDIGHPDVLDFIKAKREDGRLRKFNLSLLVSDEFLRTLEAKGDWKLAFPATKAEIVSGCELVYRKWPTDGEGRYTFDSHGRVAMKVYTIVPAVELWDVVMTSNYDFAEPGILLVDCINDMNNNWFCEYIVATNP